MWHSWFRVKSNSRGSWVLKGVKEKILIEKRKKINLRGEGSKRYNQGIVNEITQLRQNICERDTGTWREDLRRS